MNIIISNSSMQPIYEQVVSQVKQEILNGSLAPESKLPSVRELAGELRISALTVKKAYDTLEQEAADDVTGSNGDSNVTYSEPEWKSYAKDPVTGYLKDPVTGALLDPDTGEVVIGESIPAIDW